MSNFITQAEFARLYGCSDSYVSKMKRKGWLVRTQNNLVDVAASMEKVARTRDAARGGDHTRKQSKTGGWQAQGLMVVIPMEMANRFAMETDPRKMRRMLATEFRDVIGQAAEQADLRDALKQLCGLNDEMQDTNRDAPTRSQ